MNSDNRPTSLRQSLRAESFSLNRSLSRSLYRSLSHALTVLTALTLCLSASAQRQTLARPTTIIQTNPLALDSTQFKINPVSQAVTLATNLPTFGTNKVSDPISPMFRWHNTTTNADAFIFEDTDGHLQIGFVSPDGLSSTQPFIFFRDGTVQFLNLAPTNAGGQVAIFGPSGYLRDANVTVAELNLLAGATSLGSGTNQLIRTNGATLGSAGTVNWTTGVTGSISGSVATLGIDTSGSQPASAALTNLAANAANTITQATGQFTITSGTLAGAAGGNWTNLTARSSASNAVPLTIDTPTGQNTNTLDIKTNNVSTLTGVDAQGRIHVNKAVPTVALDVAGAITASGIGTFGSEVVNGSITLAGGSSVQWSSQGNITSTSAGDLDLYGSGFTALSTLYLGTRDANTHGLVLSNTPPSYHFRDGTKTNYVPISASRVFIGTNNNMAATVSIRCGTGSPESNVTGIVGDLWLRMDGGANTTLYVKESGAGNTGWIGK